jgi:hypothetical protein
MVLLDLPGALELVAGVAHSTPLAHALCGGHTREDPGLDQPADTPNGVGEVLQHAGLVGRQSHFRMVAPPRDHAEGALDLCGPCAAEQRATGELIHRKLDVTPRLDLLLLR